MALLLRDELASKLSGWSNTLEAMEGNSLAHFSNPRIETQVADGGI